MGNTIRSLRSLVCAVLPAALALAFAACGGVNNSGVGADGGAAAGGARGGAGGTIRVAGQGGASGLCKGPATDCAASTDCCSGRCEPVTGVAKTQCTDFCFADGAPCQRALDCCGLGCFGGKCGGGLCKVESEGCAANAECCSNICQGGQCQIDQPNRDCRPTGETCTSGSGRGCCTNVCDETVDPKRCAFGAETCRAQGAACTKDNDCCRGVCDPASRTCRTPCVAAGATCATPGDCCSATCTAGHCAAPPASCTPTGSACTAGGQCCTGFCFGGFCDAQPIVP
jgi:hypothetical protein